MGENLGSACRHYICLWIGMHGVVTHSTMFPVSYVILFLACILSFSFYPSFHLFVLFLVVQHRKSYHCPVTLPHRFSFASIYYSDSLLLLIISSMILSLQSLISVIKLSCFLVPTFPFTFISSLRYLKHHFILLLYNSNASISISFICLLSLPLVRFLFSLLTYVLVLLLFTHLSSLHYLKHHFSLLLYNLNSSIFT